MKRSIWAAALAGLLALGCARTPAPAAKPVVLAVLPPGANVKLILMKNLQSGRSAEGSDVPLMVADDVRDSAGHVFIPRGQLATGKVRWSRGQDAAGAVFNRPPRLTITVDGTKSVAGADVGLSAGPSGKPAEPYAFTRDNTGKPFDTAKLEALMKDPETSQALETLAREFAAGDVSSLGDSPEAQAAMRKVASQLDLPETRKLVESHQVDRLQELMSQLRKGGAVAALASGGGSTALAAVTELAGVAGEVGSRLGGMMKGRSIKAYVGTPVTAVTTDPITIRMPSP